MKRVFAMAAGLATSMALCWGANAVNPHPEKQNYAIKKAFEAATLDQQYDAVSKNLIVLKCADKKHTSTDIHSSDELAKAYQQGCKPFAAISSSIHIALTK